MKFHNQKSFMGHEISNVKNKPLLHKKGKQWIVVAISALVLAGFGGMVSTTTHADTTAQPNVTKVAPKPANNSGNASNVMKQAQGMHKALANNAAVQKPSAPSSSAAQKTTPASSASTTSAKSSSVSASSSASSKASSSVNSASARSSVASNSSSNNSNATKPAVHMFGMGNPMLTDGPSAADDMIIPPFVSDVHNAHGAVNNGVNTAKWTLDKNGTLLIHDGSFANNGNTWGNNDIPGNEINNIKYVEFKNVTIPQEFSLKGLPNVQIIDFSGLNPSTPVTPGGSSSHDWPGAISYDPNLVTINFGHNLNTKNITGDTGTFLGENPKLKNLINFSDLDLSGLTDANGFFNNDKSLTRLDLSNFNSTNARKNNNAAFGGTNGLTNFISGCSDLNTIKLGPNAILTSKAIDGNQDESYSFNPKQGLIDIADGQSHPNTWTLLQGAQNGQWGTAQWILDQNGDLIVHDGTVTFVGGNGPTAHVPGLEGKSNVIKHIYTYNVSPNPDSSSHNYFTGAYNMFSGMPNVESIDLSGVNFDNCQTMTDMFFGDNNLKSINFGNLNDGKAISNSLIPQGGNGLDGMLTGVHPNQLTFGPNTKITSNLIVGGSADNIFASDSSNPKNIIILTDGNTHNGTWNVKYGQAGKWDSAPNSATWAFDPNTYTLYLANGTMDTTTWPTAIPRPSIKHIETYNVTPPSNMNWLFGFSKSSTDKDYNKKNNLNNLQSIDLSGMDTSNVISMGWLTHTDPNLTSISFRGLDLGKVKSMSDIFASDTSLAYVDLGGIKNSTPALQQMPWMFYQNPLQYVDLSGVDTRTAVKFNNASGRTINGVDHPFNSKQEPAVLVLGPNTLFDNQSGLQGNYRKQGSNYTGPVNFNDENSHVGTWIKQDNDSVSYVNNNNHNDVIATVSNISGDDHNASDYLTGATVNGTFTIDSLYHPNLSLSDYDIVSGNGVGDNGLTFYHMNANHTVYVTPKTISEGVNYQYNNHTLATATVSGTYGTSNNTGLKGTQLANSSTKSDGSNLQDMPTGYKLLYPFDYTSKTITYNGSSFNIAITPIKATDTINYQYNGSSEGSYQFSGSDAAASGASNTNFILSNGNASGLSASYQLVNKNQSFDYDGGTYNVAVEPKSATDTINYMNGSNKVGSAEFSGAYNSSFSIGSTPSSLSSNYYSVKNPSQSFAYNNGTYDVSVSPKSISESLIFSGDSKANSTVSGVYGTSSSVSAPSGYEFSNGVNGNFSFNGSNHTFNVIPASATDQIVFNGDSAANTSMTGSYNDKGSVSAPSGYHFNGANGSFTYNNSSVSFSVAPNSATEKINYVYQNGNGTFNEGSTSMSGAYDEQGTVTSSNDKSLNSGYQLASASNSFTYANGSASDNVKVVPESASATVDYMYNGSTVSSYTSSGNNYQATDAGDTSFNANKNVPKYYHVVSDNEINYDNQTHHVNVYPNTVTVNYMYGNNNLSDDTATFDGKSKDTTIYDDSGIPAGYQLANNKASLPFNNQTVKVFITPATKSDTINYMYNSTKVGSAKVSGEDVYAGGSAFNANDDVPAGYHAVDSNNSFYYDGQQHDVNVAPNTNTDIINYMFNDTKVGSSKVSGKDMYAGGSTFNANKNVPFGYHAIDSNNGFYYDNQQHDVAVKPNTITVNYMNGKNKISSDTATFDGNSKDNSITADYDLPAGYQLEKANNQIQFNKPTNNVDVSVKPVNKTDIINYMFNDTKVGSATANGVAIYANGSTFNANNNVPAGYHAVDSNNGFYYDGQIHDVSVTPNVDTDTVNYQANGKTLASQQFKGNDEHATQAGDNSFDVTAKNATKIPNGYDLVNNNNEFSFDNGSHDVAVQAVPQPQPSVPFVPSMPASSASSASSSASTPASVAAPTSEEPTKSEPASHYRYTKVITPLQLHTSKHFTKKNGVITVKHPTEFKIMKIVHDHKYTRYEVRYNHKNYFITANDHFTINNYVQKHDFKSHKHMVVKVIKPMIEYKHIHYSKKNAIKGIRKGAVLSVKRVFTIGKGEKTRFELTNGRFVTSNKLYVKVIK